MNIINGSPARTALTSPALNQLRELTRLAVEGLERREMDELKFKAQMAHAFRQR